MQTLPNLIQLDFFDFETEELSLTGSTQNANLKGIAVAGGGGLVLSHWTLLSNYLHHGIGV